MMWATLRAPQSSALRVARRLAPWLTPALTAGRRMGARRSAHSRRHGRRGALRGVRCRRPHSAVACPYGQAYFNCAALARRSETPSAVPEYNTSRDSKRVITSARECLAHKVAPLLLYYIILEQSQLLRVIKPRGAVEPLRALGAGGLPRARIWRS